jgi:hypothetical protein
VTGGLLPMSIMPALATAAARRFVPGLDAPRPER